MPVITTTPSLKELENSVTPQHAAKWKVMGTLLGVPSGKLNAIEAGWPTNAEWCCNKMWETWLDVDTFASWEKIYAAIESPAVSGTQASVSKGNDVLYILSNYVTKNCVKQRSIDNENTWPPNQPTFYIPQNLMYHQGQCNNEREADHMIQLVHTGDNNTIDSNSVHNHHNGSNSQPSQFDPNPDNSAKVTKDIADVIAVLDTQDCKGSILIEGGSGMGKTVLLKEIAYKWALNQTFKLVILIPLQDPKVREIKSLSELLLYYCEENCASRRETDKFIACCDQISESDGKDVAFLFDSFEEFLIESWDKSFVYKLVKRKALLNSVLVVASLPHASASLREEATIRVCLLGFEMEQKKQFIKQTFKNQTQKFTEVTQYLEDNPTINNICFVPFNLVVLLYLYNHGVLFSSNLTQLYNYFITLTLCRHLAKHGHSFEHNTYDLNNLPAPCKKIIRELCKLSLLENLKTKQMKTIFTIDVIKETCADILETPGGITGFGLLHAVQHLCITGKTITFTFMHHCFQEFLAAHHVHMLDSQLKCIEFYNLFFKAGKTEICNHIANAKIFEGRAISFRGKRLSSSNIKDVTCFLNQAPQQEWEEVDLHGCNLQDSGIVILHQGLMRHNITINRLSLSDNNLTESSSSKIFDIAVHCRVKKLSVRLNTNIGKDPKLYSIIFDPNSVVEELDISSCNQSSTTELLSALGKNKKKKLRVLRINNNNITDDARGAIVKALWNNTSLVELTMHGNPINVTTALQIVKALAHNNTLQYLVLPYYDTNHQERITESAKKVDEDRYCKLDLFCNKF